MLNRKASEYPQHLLSCSQTPSALLVSQGAMQITESLRPLSNEVCIELSISAGGIGMGPAAYRRIAKRKPSSSVARSHKGAFRVHGFLFGMYPLRSWLPTAAVKGRSSTSRSRKSCPA